MVRRGSRIEVEIRRAASFALICLASVPLNPEKENRELMSPRGIAGEVRNVVQSRALPRGYLSFDGFVASTRATVSPGGSPLNPPIRKEELASKGLGPHSRSPVLIDNKRARYRPISHSPTEKFRIMDSGISPTAAVTTTSAKERHWKSQNTASNASVL